MRWYANGVDHWAAVYQGFFDEMEKISSSSGVLRHGKSRVGKRPLRVSTLIAKDKAGTLRKHAGEGSIGNSVAFAADDPVGTTGKPATAPKGINDIVPTREDGRENQAIRIIGTGKNQFAPAAANEPSEHGNF